MHESPIIWSTTLVQLFLDRVRLMDFSSDMIRWNLNACRKFTVKSYFLHVSLGNSPSSPYVCGFPWSVIWKSSTPSKAYLFAREASQGKILISDNLQKRGKLLVIGALCANQSWKPSASSLPMC